MTISLRLSDEDSRLFKSYADMHGMSLSELVRRSVMEKIDDEFDLKAFNAAMTEYKKNPVTYSHDEVARMLAFDE